MSHAPQELTKELLSDTNDVESKSLTQEVKRILQRFQSSPLIEFPDYNEQNHKT